jgi:hypothetical protein
VEATGGSQYEQLRDQAPGVPILGWRISLAASAWDVYGRRPIGEEQIRREAERLRRR